jgi:hypothetical protein
VVANSTGAAVTKRPGQNPGLLHGYRASLVKVLAVGPLQVLPLGLGIDASGGGGFVAQGILGKGQVAGEAQKLGGKPVAEGVGSEIENLENSGAGGQVLDDALDAPDGEGQDPAA